MGKKGVCVRDGMIDLFSRFHNDQMARLVSVRAPYSRLALSVLLILVERGYIRGVRVLLPKSVRAGQYNTLEVFLKYDPIGKGSISSSKPVS